MKNNTIDLINLYLQEKVSIAQSFPINGVVKLIEAIWCTYEHDATVYVFANGGPAGIADGFATDLKIHPFVSDDKKITSKIRRIKVNCLNESPSVLTAISNDLGFSYIFVEQLKNYLRSKKENKFDLMVGFSGSGNSENVIQAFLYAKKFMVTTCCISGRGGGKAKDVVDIPIVIPGSSGFPGQRYGNDNNFHIEDFQTSITHMVTGIFKDKVNKKYGR